MRAPLLEVCETRYLLADGGVSTYLRLNKGDSSNTTEQMNLSDPSSVLSIHEQFAEAGADCLTTNTFSANQTRNPDLSIEECNHICSEGVRLARQAAGPDRYVLASVGPWYQTADNWEKAFKDQVRTLADAGADAIYIETVSSLEAARAMSSLVRSASSSLPVIISFSFTKTSNEKIQLSGDSATLSDIASALSSVEANAFGINCGCGLDIYDYSTLVSAFREATGKPIFARPSAGDPEGVDPEHPTYPDSSEYMTEAIWGLVRAGANVIGGCCGVSPEHIRAFRTELDMLG